MRRDGGRRLASVVLRWMLVCPTERATAWLLGMVRNGS